LVEYIAPPAAGALIGYLTNYIAIKMLFKPVRPYYLFGFRLPFTPGLIPAKREKLAEAIARVVKENLLTEESIRRRLNHEKVRESLLQFTESFLSELSARAPLYARELSAKLEDRRLGDLLPLKEIEERGEEAVEALFKRLHGKKLREVLPESLEREIERLIDEKLEEITASLTRQLKRGELSEVIYTAVYENILKLKSFFPLLSEQMASSMARRTTALIEEVVKRAAQEPAFKAKLSKLIWSRFQELLSKEIDSESETVRRLKGLIKSSLREAIEKNSRKRLKELPSVRNFIEQELPLFAEKLVREHREELARIISDRLLEVIERELPIIMEGIDIEELVKERVNALPIEEVEEIVLKLIDEELKHITLLGGVLGFFIGLTQVLLLL
jgi:uncharacterized membrane protein YheB (UPF0754 family)